MRWTLGLCAAAALAVAASSCGSTISVPDQGIIVTGCQMPAQCYRSDCDCTRDQVESGACAVACVQSDPSDPATCNCPTDLGGGGDAGATITSVCIEMAQACIGRGVLCAGPNARCKAPASVCDGTGDLPMLIPTIGMPMLEPHCQFVGDICCNSSPTDGGVPTD